MANCDEIVLWNVPANSKFRAESSAVTSVASGTIAKGTPTADYACVVNISPGGGGASLTWDNSNLDPGPASKAVGDQGYAATVTLAPGPSNPTITFHAWIEAPSGTKPFDCTWTNATPNLVITLF
ncbi:MAG: hypothetical protein QOK37_3355 [Thermoanaerobaculia bacterium]|jgi:hypothetical protein|nr:hypothetical protein [Thermoanaerobaculia bacterium]